MNNFHKGLNFALGLMSVDLAVKAPNPLFGILMLLLAGYNFGQVLDK